MRDSLIVLLVLVAVVVSAATVAAFGFRECARWVARKEIRRYLADHPPLPKLGPGDE